MRALECQQASYFVYLIDLILGYIEDRVFLEAGLSDKPPAERPPLRPAPWARPAWQALLCHPGSLEPVHMMARSGLGSFLLREMTRTHDLGAQHAAFVAYATVLRHFASCQAWVAPWVERHTPAQLDDTETGSGTGTTKEQRDQLLKRIAKAETAMRSAGGWAGTRALTRLVQSDLDVPLHLTHKIMAAINALVKLGPVNPELLDEPDDVLSSEVIDPVWAKLRKRTVRFVDETRQGDARERKDQWGDDEQVAIYGDDPRNMFGVIDYLDSIEEPVETDGLYIRG